MRLRVSLVGFGLTAAVCCASTPAGAFEREWHVGAGAGIADGKGLTMSPALSAYAAYGLSDAFDARVEVTARGYRLGSDQNPHALNAMAGLAYKLDILRWVPWVAVYAGYTAFLEAPRPTLSYKPRDFALALGVGLDYAVSRNFGLGVTVRLDQALGSQSDRTIDALLRAEYRWGW